MMKHINLFLSIFAISFAVNICRAESNKGYISIPIKDRGHISFVYIPVLGDNDVVWFKEVPAKLYGSSPNNMIDSMCAPVYPASPVPQDRNKDINLISLYRISMNFKELKEEEGYDLIIDLKEAKKPSGSKYELDTVVQAAITCVRIQYSPRYLGKVNIKIVGISKNPRWTHLEGLLWPN